MAETNKPKRPKATRAKPKAAKAEPVEDAVVIEEAAAAAEVTQDVKSKVVSDDIGKTTKATAKAVENGTTATPDNVTLQEDAAEVVAVAATPITSTPQRGRFFPIVFGGFVAACIGAAALYFAQTYGWVSFGPKSDGLAARIETQSTEIAELRNAITTMTTDLGTVQSGLTPLQGNIDSVSGNVTAVSEQVTGLNTALAQTNERITGIELQPIPKAELPAEVVTAYEAQLTKMLATVDGRFATMQETLDTRLAELSAVQATASATEEAALKAADLAAAKAALAQVRVALDSGSAFGEQLDVIAAKSGADIPATLTDAAEGVTTLAALKTNFPELARTALAASTREAASDGSVGPLTAFFRTQLGARSLEPREGDDPDAVLSRAEAAVGNGDLDTAIAEIAALPQVGQDALADWVIAVNLRRTSLSAADELAATFETN